jgi:hypothetical protein
MLAALDSGFDGARHVIDVVDATSADALLGLQTWD